MIELAAVLVILLTVFLLGFVLGQAYEVDQSLKSDPPAPLVDGRRKETKP